MDQLLSIITPVLSRELIEKITKYLEDKSQDHERVLYERDEEIRKLKDKLDEKNKKNDKYKSVIKKIAPEVYSVMNDSDCSDSLEDINRKFEIQCKCAKYGMYSLESEIDRQKLKEMAVKGAFTHAKIDKVYLRNEEHDKIGFNKLLKICNINRDYDVNANTFIETITSNWESLGEGDMCFLGISITLRRDKDTEMGTIYISPRVM